MKIKRFKAKQFSEALSKVKRELGKDAVILSSEELADGTVEVVAAIDLSAEKPAGMEKTLSPNEEISSLKAEIERLRDALLEMKRTGYELRLPENKRRLLKLLLGQSIKEEFALRLCEKATDLQSLYDAITEELSVFDIKNSQKIIMLVGSTGAGKTTTLCKLAADSIRRKKKIAIVTLDTYRLGATYQLSAFARVLGVPLEVARNTSEFKEKIEKHLTKDRIFVDTTGKNPSDREYIEDLRQIYSLEFPIETHLIMSASSEQDFLIQAYQSYRALPIQCLGFTKIDEATKKGCIYNLSVLYQKPIAYLTNGQTIPRDIIFPDRETITGLILQKEC
ncbi:MAG: hypothetical protein D6710_00700 [Nitrospirae bacterium]|nr:MAG: hypothetical protein D6710_00700 [Nitrospirota bacterium]